MQSAKLSPTCARRILRALQPENSPPVPWLYAQVCFHALRRTECRRAGLLDCYVLCPVVRPLSTLWRTSAVTERVRVIRRNAVRVANHRYAVTPVRVEPAERLDKFIDRLRDKWQLNRPPPTTLQLHAALPPLSHLLHPSLFILAVRITRQIRLALISRVHVSYACQSLDPVDSLLIVTADILSRRNFHQSRSST